LTADPGGDGPPARAAPGKHARYKVDARGAEAVVVGDHNTQINYYYHGTWGDDVAESPLVSVSGKITSPYRGLSLYNEQDAALFFGRDADADAVLRQMSRCLGGAGLLVISGVSGAGKSSLLRAGVLPRIRGTGLASAPEARWWPCVVFTPTDQPLAQLALQVAHVAGVDAAAVHERLSGHLESFALTVRQAAHMHSARPAAIRGMTGGAGQHRVLVVVDQVEQLFTRCQDTKQQQAFIAALHAAATIQHGEERPPALVVLMVRADFEARLADYPQLTSAVRERYLLTSMTELQLRTAITQPAAVVGSSVDGHLVQVLLEDIRAHAESSSGSAAVTGAGVLPLLSHVLDQAWRHRAGQVLTLADYERAGGIEGAVADSAQRAYDQLTAAQQVVARQVFTRLTITTGDGIDTAARADRRDLTGGERDAQDIDAVLETFAAERLLTLAAETVEISHEALLTAWPLLRDTWLADTKADRITRTQLHVAADQWIRASRNRSYLYGGSRLAVTEAAAARINTDARYLPLSRTEKDFLNASRRASRRRVRLWQGATAILAVLVVAVALTAVAARHAGQVASRQRDAAVSEQLVNDSQALGGTNATASRLESIAAWSLDQSAQARYAMLSDAASPEVATFTDPDAAGITSIRFSPDGKTLATGEQNGTIRLWDMTTYQPSGPALVTERRPVGQQDPVGLITFSPSGTSIATGDIYDGSLREWNLTSYRQSTSPFTTGTRTGDGDVSTLALSPNGTILATGNQLHGTIRLWDTATRRLIGTPLNAGFYPTASLAFSPDGTTLATGGNDATARLWDVATHQLIRKLTAITQGSGGVNAVAFSPDGKILATAGDGGIIRLWDVATGQQIGADITSSSDQIQSITFSPDGTMLADSFNGQAQVWDVATHRQIETFTGTTDSSEIVAFSPDGKILATGDSSGTVRLWNVTASGEQVNISGERCGSGCIVTFSRDGTIAAIAAYRGATVQLWDVTTRRRIGAPIRATRSGSVHGLLSMTLSPDGKMLATDDGSGVVRLWNVATRVQGGVALTTDSYGLWFAFSPDGKTLAATGGDGTVWLWDTATGHRIAGRLNVQSAGTAAFSPDGKILATDDAFGKVQLWDITNKQQIGRPLSAASVPEAYAIAFSPDGKSLAATTGLGGVQLWNVASHQRIGAPLTANSDSVQSVTFSPDGKTLAVFSTSMRLWDIATQQQIGAPLAAGSIEPMSTTSVTFTPDGDTLAVGSQNGILTLWNVSYLGNVLTQLCPQIGGSLTQAEWTRYVPAGVPFHQECP
jgi:WD40 repeat protein